MKNTTTNLSFDELEKEMEVLDRTSTKSVLGGKFPPKAEPIDPDSAYNGSLGGGGGYVSDGKNSGFNSGYTLGGFTGAGNTPSMDNSSSSNPNGNNGPGPLPTITIGNITAAGIYQEIQFSNAGSYVPGYGGFADGMSSSGKIGFELNAQGQWLAVGDFTVIPPKSFEHAQTAGNVYISLNGIEIGSFSLRDTFNNNLTQVKADGTFVLNGNYVMPSTFNGQGNVTFDIRIGATEFDGNDNYHTNSSEKVTLTLTPKDQHTPYPYATATN